MNNGTLLFHYLNFNLPGGVQFVANVLIGPPVMVDENQYECEFSFEYFGTNEVYKVRAGTEMHALWVAMAMAGEVVKMHPAAQYLREAALPNYGFPPLPQALDQLPPE